MARTRIACIVGTRPEIIKMAPVVWELRRRSEVFETFMVTTGQHREILDQMTGPFNLCPDVDLNLMEVDQTPAEVIQRALVAIEPIFRDLRPQVILVQGDTTTVMATALAAYLHRIPLGHIEAGLRSFEKYEPFPEELNRRVTSLVAEWHFAPTERAQRNLLREGVNPQTVYVTGNTVVDALVAMRDAQPSVVPEVLNRLDFANRKVILVTAHRRESHGPRLRAICQALGDLVSRNEDVELVYPVHPNPHVRSTVNSLLRGVPRIHLVPPLGYQEMIGLMSRCYLILTDSGGIQEEAPTLGTPVLVLREVTERPEGIEAGTARLVGTDRATIVRETERLLRDPAERRSMTRHENPYGDGKAAQRIADILARPRPVPLANRDDPVPWKT